MKKAMQLPFTRHWNAKILIRLGINPVGKNYVHSHKPYINN